MKLSLLNLVPMIGCILLCAKSAAGSPPQPRFQESFHHALGDYWSEPGRLSVVDVDADGRKDILLMTTALASPVGPPWSFKSRVTWLRGQADGGFAASKIADFPGDYGYNIATGDLNNDGTVDFVVCASQVTHVFTNDIQGGFGRAGTAPSGYYPGPLMDVNRDGRLDIVSGNQTLSGGLVMVSTNAGGGYFRSAWQSRLYGFNYDSVETVLKVNLNGDAIPDLAAREIYGGRLITFFGTTNTSVPFVEHQETYLGDRTFGLASGNVNGDSLDDLVVHVGWGEARVLVNLGGGVMSNAWTTPDLGQAAYNLALADFDQDGRDDLFIGTFGDGRLHIYRNNGANGFEDWWEGSVPGNGYTGSVADLNGDGAPDLIVGEKNSIRILINQTGWPQITRLEPVTNGMRITWSSRPGKRYRVRYRDRWSDLEWVDLDVEVTSETSVASHEDESGSNGGGQRFYRVMELP